MIGEQKISARVYKDESERLSREQGLGRAVDELIASVPDDMVDREKVVAAIREATRITNTSVQKFFPERPNPGEWVGERPFTWTTNITDRGFFNNPKTVKKYGSEVVASAVKCISDFSAQKAGLGK